MKYFIVSFFRLRHSIFVYKSNIIKSLLAIITLAFLVYWVEWDKIQSSFLAADWRYVCLALLLLPLNLALQAWMWQTLIRKIYPEEGFWDSLGAVLCGSALGLMTPAKLGDYAGRAYYLKHTHKWQLAALMGVQQVISMGAYIGIGILALNYFLLTHAHLATMVWYLVVIGGVLSLLFMVTALLHPKLVYGFIIEHFPQPKVQKVFSFLTHLSIKDLYLLFTQAMVRYFVFATQFLLLIYAFHPTISLWDATIAACLMFFAKTVLPAPTLAELGIRESSAIYFFGIFGVSAAVAFNASMLITVINIFIPALLGVPFILRMRLSSPKTDATATIERETKSV